MRESPDRAHPGGAACARARGAAPWGAARRTGRRERAGAAVTTGETGRRAGRETVVFVAWVIAALYLALLPAHLLLLDGRARVTMAVLAGLSSAVAAGLARATSRSRVPERRLGAVLTVVAAAPLVNSLVHTAVTRGVEQTAVVMLSLVALGAIVQRVAAVVLSLSGVAAWVVIVAVERLGPRTRCGTTGSGSCWPCCWATPSSACGRRASGGCARRAPTLTPWRWSPAAATPAPTRARSRSRR
nr:hypothetical protein [Angustibacter aerolatus]